MDKEYNRIVLIGNGFDKALGLKTSYSDFILNYLREAAIEAFCNETYNTELITLKLKIPSEDIIQELNGCKTIEEALVIIKEAFEISYKYDFLEDIVANFVDARWVNIEQYYYDTLRHEFRSYKDQSEKVKDQTNILALNNCMDKLTVALNNFIREQQITISLEHIDSLSSLIDSIGEPLRLKISKLVKKHHRQNAPSEVLFLNFNYTNTVQQIINNSFVKGNNKHLFIHGTVNDEENPIIFGYGDDTGEDYKELELEVEGRYELLRKIKSFQYPKTHNYHNLLNHLETSEFDVFVVGHSCGLSDKTLLKTIFEHPNCLAIQNFHYKDNGEQEDFNKRIEISRHFSDKILMRERVLPYDKFASIPQIQQKKRANRDGQ